MISRKQNMQYKREMLSGFNSEYPMIVMKGAILSTLPSTVLSGIQISNTSNLHNLEDSERPESIDNCNSFSADY